MVHRVDVFMRSTKLLTGTTKAHLMVHRVGAIAKSTELLKCNEAHQLNQLIYFSVCRSINITHYVQTYVTVYYVRFGCNGKL